MTKKSDIDNIFKHGLDDFAPKPPGFVWDNVQNQLKSKRAVKRRNILYSAAASVALFLSFGAGYLFHFFSPADQVNIAQNTELTTGDAVVENPKEDYNLIAEGQNTEQIIVNTPDVKSVDADINSIGNDAEVMPEDQEQVIPESENNSSEESDEHEGENNDSGNSNIKKVKSSGTLIPPSFALGTVVYKESDSSIINENTSGIVKDDEEIYLPSLKSKSALLMNAEDDDNNELLKRRVNSNDSDQSLIEEPLSDLWSVGVSGTPLVSYRNISNAPANSHTSDNNYNSTNGYSNEKPLIAYAAAVDIEYNVYGKWSIQSGFVVSKTGQISEGMNLNAVSLYNASQNSGVAYNIHTSLGNESIRQVDASYNAVLAKASGGSGASLVPSPSGSLPASSVSADLVQTFSYIEIPMVLSYSVIDSKLGFDVMGGVSTNVLYGNSSYLKSENERYSVDSELSDLKKVSYSGLLGIGLTYPLVNSLQVGLQPTFRYSLTPVNPDGSVYPYSFGVFTGVQYQF